MKKLLIMVIATAAASLALSVFASDDDWVYDTSSRPTETVSVGEASLGGIFDSRWRDWEESEPGALDMNPRGTMMVFR